MFLDIELNKSLFLLFLVVSGNYIGELLGCQTQKFFSESMYAKHIILICLIFFTINLIGENSVHPLEVLKKSLLLWSFYLILTKMDLNITLVVLSLLFSLYVYDEYQKYMDNNKINYDKKQYENNKVYIQYLIMIIILIGFIKYYLRQKKEHKSEFNHIKYLLGTSQCNFKK